MAAKQRPAPDRGLVRPLRTARHRDVRAGASLANSVVIRCQHDPDYRPKNLTLGNDDVPTGYQRVGVVAEPV